MWENSKKTEPWFTFPVGNVRIYEVQKLAMNENLLDLLLNEIYGGCL